MPKLPKYPQHQYFTDLSSNFMILPNYPHNRQLSNCPQFRLHKLTILSEITKLPSNHKITKMSITRLITELPSKSQITSLASLKITKMSINFIKLHNHPQRSMNLPNCPLPVNGVWTSVNDDGELRSASSGLGESNGAGGVLLRAAATADRSSKDPKLSGDRSVISRCPRWS